MNERKALEDISAQFNKESLVTSCGGEGCKVDMDGLPRELVVVNLETEFDSRKKTEKRCDRLLFFRDQSFLFVATIELKSGKAPESDVIEKTENSLNFARQIVSTLPRSKPIYVPILFHGRGIKWTNPRKKKQGLKVSFGGGLTVQTDRCGRERNLAGILFQKKRR
ncbi:hypothetical protein C6495_09860 [Candidatus Poribacteria bacterium]|nr:MAG: hypothetical protein C6495_09860 [Candidatus Poribacteria bacterium]